MNILAERLVLHTSEGFETQADEKKAQWSEEKYVKLYIGTV